MSDDPTRTLADLTKGGTTLMVSTKLPDGSVDSRPLTVAAVDDDRIRILIDTTADWAKDLADGDWVHATLSDTRANDFAAMSGTLTTTQEPAVIDELWSPFAGAYFDDGRETPGITVMSIDVESGSFWDSPSGRIGSLVLLIKAKVGDGEDSGAHGDLDV